MHTLKQDSCLVKKVRRCWSCPWHQTKPSSKGPFPSELPLGGQALLFQLGFQEPRNGHLPAPLQSWCWHSPGCPALSGGHCRGPTAPTLCLSGLAVLLPHSECCWSWWNSLYFLLFMGNLSKHSQSSQFFKPVNVFLHIFSKGNIPLMPGSLSEPEPCRRCSGITWRRKLSPWLIQGVSPELALPWGHRSYQDFW